MRTMDPQSEAPLDQWALESRRSDFRSDNACHPTDAMRRCMAEAPVGDDALGEDPTVTALEREVAQLLGKAGAVFMPSGVMCNVVAYHVYCGWSQEQRILLEAESHPVYSGYCALEIGGPKLALLRGERGIL